MISVGILKSAQLKKLFIILQYSRMKNLEIFGAMEGICFEFKCLNPFWKLWENSNPCGARLSVALSEHRRPGRTSASRPQRRRHGFTGLHQVRELLPFCLVASISRSGPRPCFCYAPPRVVPTPTAMPHHKSSAHEHHLSVTRPTKHQQLPPQEDA
jgi:hypothetical protein